MLTLDVGCGCNEVFEGKARGFVNVDIRKPIVKIDNFVLCDCYILPFPTNFFDKVFIFEVIEHLDTPIKALKEIKRVLKKNGVLRLLTPNGLHILKIALTVKRGFYYPHFDHISIWNVPELKQLLKKSGFVNVETFFVCDNEGHSLKLIEKIILLFCVFKCLKARLLLCVAS